MSKIAITADIHFGLPGRLRDILWACRVMREYCKEAGIDTVVVLGDMFHDRRSLDIETLSSVAEFFEQTTSAPYDQHWIVFPGNHDMFLRHSWKINSLQILRRHLTVIEDVKLLELDGARFWVLPFISFEKSYMQALYQVCRQAKENDSLFTHIGAAGAELNTCFLLQHWSTVSFVNTPFKRVYAGHFHSRQQVSENLWYPGSPIPFKFDEGDCSHGFYSLDLHTMEHKFINIWKAGARFIPNEPYAPQFCTFLDELLPTKTATDIAGNMIRIAAQREYTIEEKNTIRQRLLAAGAIAVRWMNLYQKRDQEVIVREQRDIKDVFRSWYDSDKEKGAKDLDESVLFSIHTDVLREADELYAVEAAET